MSGEPGGSPGGEEVWKGGKRSVVVVRNRDGEEFKMNYMGAVSGDEMKLTITMAQMDRTFEMTATRVK